MLFFHKGPERNTLILQTQGVDIQSVEDVDQKVQRGGNFGGLLGRLRKILYLSFQSSLTNLLNHIASK